MTSNSNNFLTANNKITLGIFWFVIAIIFIVNRIINNLDILFWDWISWIAIFTAGIVSFIEGFRMKRN